MNLPQPPPPPRETRRWLRLVLIWGAVGFGAALALVLAVGIAGWALFRSIDDSTWMPSDPPSNMAVCRSQLNEVCVKEASRLVGSPVAWMSPPEGFRFEWVLASETRVGAYSGFSYEYMASDRSTLLLETESSAPAPSPGDRVWSTSVNGVPVQVIESFADPGYTVTISWSHGGVAYDFFGAPFHLNGGEAPNVTDLLPMVGRVQYSAAG